MKDNSKKLYTCYSVPQMKYLSEHGVKYELVALNKNTKNTMWIYFKDEKLDKLLNEWSKNKKVN